MDAAVMDAFATVPVGPRTPGVYILLRRGAVVWIGTTKNLLSRLYAHAQHDRGKPLHAGMPRHPVLYDEARVRPATLEALDDLYALTCNALAWSPPP